MALKKEIRFPNGVKCEYHRIALISIDVNNQITVLVRSYLDEDGRQYEKDYESGLIQDPIFPYTQAEYKYIEDTNSDILKGDIVSSAYAWLKRQPEYQDSIDV